MSAPHFLYCLLSFFHTIAIGEVATLNHELLDDSVEGGSLVTEALLARAQSTEVLGGLGNCLPIETYDDSAQFLIPVRDIEKDLRVAVN